MGFPFDGTPAAAYALVHATAHGTSVELRRVEYNVNRTIEELARQEVPWAGPIRSALQRSLSFFSDEVKTDNEPSEYETTRT